MITSHRSSLGYNHICYPKMYTNQNIEKKLPDFDLLTRSKYKTQKQQLRGLLKESSSGNVVKILKKQNWS